jgi:hypothetical protein
MDIRSYTWVNTFEVNPPVASTSPIMPTMSLVSNPQNTNNGNSSTIIIVIAVLGGIIAGIIGASGYTLYKKRNSKYIPSSF